MVNEFDLAGQTTPACVVNKEDQNMENLVKALKRFDSLETVIAELEAYDYDSAEEVTVEDLADYLNDEADYAI